MMMNHSDPSRWKQQLRHNFTSIDKLADFLELTPEQKTALLQQPRFILNLPRRLAEKMDKGSLTDPLFLQFVPLKLELDDLSGYFEDPVGDQCFRKSHKLLHKYHGRVLLLCTSACAMHCRYCFRQNFPYEVKDSSFREELDMIRQDDSIHEVILSGGDPLSLSDERLDELLSEVDKIEHIKRIRFHTRFPLGIPERIDDHFMNILKTLSKQLIFVFHINHPRELGNDLFDRTDRLRQAGYLLLNQSVLLKGVNNDAAILTELFESLSDHGILPYYLHQLDRVKGAAHYEVAEAEGRRLLQEVSKKLPGYAVPRYAREDQGAPHKTILPLE